MLPCVCSVIDHRGSQNVVRTKKWHRRRSRVSHWCSYHILASSVIYYWTDARQHGIYLLILLLLILLLLICHSHCNNAAQYNIPFLYSFFKTSWSIAFLRPAKYNFKAIVSFKEEGAKFVHSLRKRKKREKNMSSLPARHCSFRQLMITCRWWFSG